MGHLVRTLFSLLLAVSLAPALAGVVRADGASKLGLEVESVTDAIAAAKGLAIDFGVYVRAVKPDSPAKDGLAAGDVITKINGVIVTDIAAYEAALASAKSGQTVQFSRARPGEATKVVAVTLRTAVPKPSGAKVAIAEPPQLMLDTGGHMAIIKSVKFTPDGRFLMSAADDKVIRIWDWRAGKTVRTIRGEVGPGDEGKIFAAALSPDGTMLATGGFVKGLDNEIRLYDFATGTLTGLLKGHTNVVMGLAFSPDGKRLVSGSGDSTAIIWDVAGRKALFRLKGHTNDIYAVAFTPDGERVVTGSDDTMVRMWRVSDGTLVTEMAGHQGLVRAIAAQPLDPRTGAKSQQLLIASGDRSGEIRLWDAASGRGIKTLAKVEEGIGALAFTPKGDTVISSCRSGVTCSTKPVRVWDVAKGVEIANHPGHENIVLAATISNDGKYAASADSVGEIHIWEPATGKLVKGLDGQPLILKGTGRPTWAVGFSQDSTRLAWGSTFGHPNGGATPANNRGELEYQLRLPRANGERLGQVEPVAAASGPWVRAEFERGPLVLNHRKGGPYGGMAILDMSRDGKVAFSVERGPTDGYQHRSYSFAPDGKSVISGGDAGFISEYDLTGKPLGNFVGHVADVWAVTPSPDGRYLVSGSSDQTVRLWNLKTREPIITIYRGTDSEWVAWTPQGYYAGSPKGGELVGWQVNRGTDQAAEYVRGKQLREKLFRPDVVSKAIELASATDAVKALGLDGVDVGSILSARPPVVALDADPAAAGGRGTIMVSILDTDIPVTAVAVFVSAEGKPEVNVTPKPLPLPDGFSYPRPGYAPETFQVPLYEGVNTVRVVATNEIGESEPSTATITHTGEGALNKRGVLRVLAIGVDKYPNANKVFRDLKYAGADAIAFSESAVRRMGPLHTKSDVVVLTNGSKQGEPTRANIEAALGRFEKDATDQDTLVVFFAGHGEAWTDGHYHVMATDLARESSKVPGVNFVDWATIQGTITRAKGRRLIFVDACRSGSANTAITAYNDKLTSDALADRFVAFSATSSNQNAWELGEEKHGAFTSMLMAGLDKAVDPKQQAVTVYRLGAFINEEVAGRTGGKQTPEFLSGQGNFALAR